MAWLEVMSADTCTASGIITISKSTLNKDFTLGKNNHCDPKQVTLCWFLSYPKLGFKLPSHFDTPSQDYAVISHPKEIQLSRRFSGKSKSHNCIIHILFKSFTFFSCPYNLYTYLLWFKWHTSDTPFSGYPSYRLIDWLIDWLIHMVGWLIDWLID